MSTPRQRNAPAAVTTNCANKEKPIAYDQVLADMIRRDRIDSERALAPLRLGGRTPCGSTTATKAPT
jgi:cytidylate kinase